MPIPSFFFCFFSRRLSLSLKKIRKVFVLFYNEPVISFVFSKKLNHFKKDFRERVINGPHPHTSKASSLSAELHTAVPILLYILTHQDVIICFCCLDGALGWPGACYLDRTDLCHVLELKA